MYLKNYSTTEDNQHTSVNLDKIMPISILHSQIKTGLMYLLNSVLSLSQVQVGIHNEVNRYIKQETGLTVESYSFIEFRIQIKKNLIALKYKLVSLEEAEHNIQEVIDQLLVTTKENKAKLT
jgi:hypothetical protein